MITQLRTRTNGQGLYEITEKISALLARTGVSDGLCSLFLQHTSASLLVQENADPSAKRDLEKWLRRLVPERDPLYSHTTEGDDDMPAHIKAALTNIDLAIPIQGGVLALGTWQGIYIWEHRDGSHERTVLVTVMPLQGE